MKVSSERPTYVHAPRPSAPATGGLEALAEMRRELEPWQAEGTWGPHRSCWLGWSRGFSDSPGSKYENNANSSLTSGPLSLAGVREPRLEFREHHELESGYDHVRVEVQNVADGKWRELDALTGSNLNTKRSYSLTGYEGATIRIRLRLTSDGSNPASGIETGPIRIVGRGVSFTPEEQCRRSLARLEELAPSEAVAVRDLSQRVGGVTAALDLWPDLAGHLGQADYSARRDALVALHQQSARRAWSGLERASAREIPSGLAHAEGLVRELGPDGAELLASLGAGASKAERDRLIELARREGIEPAARGWAELRPGQPGLDERLELRELARQGGWAQDELASLGLGATERAAVKTVLEAPSGWRPEGSWARRGRGWDDSPGQDYSSHADSSLYLPVLNLNERTGCQLAFRESHDLESNYDFVRLEASRDGKSDWKPVGEWTGSAWFRKRHVDLSAYDGGPVHLRFRLTSDGSNQASGIRLGAMELRSDQGSQSVEDRSRVVRERLRQCLEPAPDRGERLVRLARATETLGSAEEALALWPHGCSDDLVRLARRLGSRGAASVWPSLEGLSAPQREQALGCLEDLRSKHPTGDVVRLWGALAPAASSPDFKRLRASLVELAEQEGVAAAVRRFGGMGLAGAASVERSVHLHDLALRLEPRRSDRLWEQLKAGPVDAAVLEQLDAHIEDWRPEGSWARVRPASWAFREVWQDSPGGSYGSHANTSLTTPPLSLAGLRKPRVEFWSAYSLESGYDHVQVEASTDGTSWKPLESYTGRGLRRKRSVDLAEYAGKSVLLRFRLTSDGSNQQDGISLGRLVVHGQDERGRAQRRVVDPRAAETRSQLARLALESPADLPELLEVARLAGGTRNALALWSVVRGASPERRATAASLAGVVGVENALAAWKGLQACPDAQLPGVVESARACPKGWSALASDVAEPDLPERAAALNRLVHHLGEEEALRRWPGLCASSLGGLADRVEAEELAARLEGRVQELDRSRLATSGLGPEGTDALRDLVGERQECSLKAEGTWARVRSPWWLFRPVWQDSPGGNYENHADSSLTSVPISLADLSEPVLRFSEHHDLESGYDYLGVEVSSDGRSWSQLDSYTGSNRISRRELDLSAHAGKRVQVRFRLTSDGSTTRSGVSIGSPRIEARRGQEKVVLELDDLPLDDVTPYLELALDTTASASQRTACLKMMAELSETQRSVVLEFCARHRSVSLAEAMNALAQARLTADPNDPKWLDEALARLPELLTVEQAVGETEHNVTIGGVILKKRGAT